MGHWVHNLPAELGYAVASAAVLGVLGWLVARIRGDQRERAPLERPPRRNAPRLLPPAPQRFVNRADELATLDDLLRRAKSAPGPVVAVVSGMHGVGKSAIGSLWAHSNHQHFRDGVLTGDFSRRRHPHGVRTSDVLADFLRALGVSDVAMPTTLRERRSRFEQLTADREMLMVLDDVEDPAQALTMYPTGRGSVVLVTSASSLEELVRSGAEPVILEPLGDTAARNLLADIARPARFDADPASTQKILAACGGLPIALCVCGARLATRRQRSAAWLAEQLDPGLRRLSTLSPPGAFDVSAVFAMAYNDLGTRETILYRRLGLHPGATFTAAAAAAVAGMPIDAVGGLLEQLRASYLIADAGHQRFRAHDLIRDHMGACAATDEGDDEHAQAIERVVVWYVAAAQAADHAVVRDRIRLPTRLAMTAENLPDLRSPPDAFGWFATEAQNILAAQRVALEREWNELTWLVAEALWPLCASHKRFSEWIESHDAAVIAGERLGDLRVVARMRSQLARAYAELGDHKRAAGEMHLALHAASQAGDDALLASVIEFDGVCRLRAGDYAAALEAFARARGAFEACNRRRGVALQDYHVGWCLVLAGDPELALEPLERASHEMHELGDLINVGRCLVRQGEAFSRLGRTRDARRALDEAIGVLDRAGVEFEQAEAHETLALLAEREHDSRSAAGHRRSAYRLYRELGHPRADVLLATIERDVAAELC